MQSRRRRASWLAVGAALALVPITLAAPVRAANPPHLTWAFGDCVTATETAYIDFNSSGWKSGTNATLSYGSSEDTITVPGNGTLAGQLTNTVWPTTLTITGTGADNAGHTLESASIADPGCTRVFTMLESYCDADLGSAIRFESDNWQVNEDMYEVTVGGRTFDSSRPAGVYRNRVWPTTVFIEALDPTYAGLDTLESASLPDPGPCGATGMIGIDKMVALDRSTDAYFGGAVAVDGTTAVVGAKSGGGAYVFTRSGDTWSQATKLIPFDGAGNFFGTSVAISGDTAVVGAPGADIDLPDGGAAYVFIRNGGTWSEQARLTPSDPKAGANFGQAVAIDGHTVVVGAPAIDGNVDSSGAAYVFTRSGVTWSQQAKLTGSDAVAGGLVGHAVDLSGATAIVGGPAANGSTGAAYVFVRVAGAWSQQGKLGDPSATSGADLGYAVAVDGAVAVIGAPRDNVSGFSNPGSAYIFTRSSGTWSQKTKLSGAPLVGDFFGWSVGIAGTRAVIGAPDQRATSGIAYVFEQSGGQWPAFDEITAFNGPEPFFFGSSVHASGDLIIVGDPVEGPDGEGAAYVFETAPPSCNGHPATILGTEASEELRGTPGDDVMVGLGGNDIMRGNGGNDIMCGGDGDDELYGGVGDDTMFGEAGNDLIRGVRGNDVAYGGAGDDRLQDGPGADVLWGGPGKDKMWGGIGDDVLRGEGGNDQLHGNRDADTLYGGGNTDRIWGDAGIDTMYGGPNSDFLYGGIDADFMWGGDGNDRLFGWTGADELYGEAGRDQLRGQDGDDLVDGGPDSDFCSVEPTMIDCEIFL